MEITNIINEYAEKKEQFDKLKKECDKLSKQIKDVLRDDGDRVDYTTDLVSLKLTVSYRTSLNEDKAISILQGTDTGSAVIKTKLYVDTDALEDLIYKEQVDADLMKKLQECIDTKRVETIRVYKNKKGGN